ncbi:MAG: DUF5804 family protein [Halobacteriaceae archaeon]
MTEVCIVGEDTTLHDDLVAYETARRALSAYDVAEPYVNAVVVETISLGTAVSLVNDLDWYLARVAREAVIRDPSVSATEWLSRDVATAVRDGDLDPDDTGPTRKLYGVVEEELEDAPGRTRRRLVEPMYVTGTGDSIPGYDLHDVVDTLVIRVLPEEVPG